jgi:hypothetical protein
MADSFVALLFQLICPGTLQTKGATAPSSLPLIASIGQSNESIPPYGPEDGHAMYCGVDKVMTSWKLEVGPHISFIVLTRRRMPRAGCTESLDDLVAVSAAAAACLQRMSSLLKNSIWHIQRYRYASSCMRRHHASAFRPDPRNPNEIKVALTPRPNA